MKKSNCVRNPLWLALSAGALAVLTLSCACADKADPDYYVKDRVNSVRELTVPSDSTVTNNPGPILGAYSATARWEFETTEARKVYLSWVSQQLERDDFKLESFDASSLDFTEIFRGEAQYVKIQAKPSNGKLHVQVAYAIDSD